MSKDYGMAHMGVPIVFSYQGATVPGMGTIGDRIRKLRKEAELTQAVLAKLVGIDQSTLSDIERGADFSAETLMRLAEGLETSCEYIMRGQHIASPQVRKAQQALGKLSDQERLELLTAIMQPPKSDSEVEQHLPPAPYSTAPSKEERRLYEAAQLPAVTKRKPLAKRRG